MLNESIVATGIYYLAQENIVSDNPSMDAGSPSHLEFRVGLGQELEAEVPYEQVTDTTAG